MSRKKAIELAKHGCIVSAYEELGITGKQLIFARLYELGAFDAILEESKSDPELSDFDRAILKGRGIT